MSKHEDWAPGILATAALVLAVVVLFWAVVDIGHAQYGNPIEEARERFEQEQESTQTRVIAALPIGGSHLSDGTPVVSALVVYSDGTMALVVQVGGEVVVMPVLRGWLVGE